MLCSKNNLPIVLFKLERQEKTNLDGDKIHSVVLLVPAMEKVLAQPSKYDN